MRHMAHIKLKLSAHIKRRFRCNFNAHLRGNSSLATFDYADECLHNGDIKLCLSFKSVGKATGKVIGIDRRSMDEFLLKARANTHALTSFVNMNMVSLFQGSPFCKTMTPEQVLL